MEIQFELNVKITGSSLDDIDKGLAKAAGERIIARLEKPLKMPNIGGHVSNVPSSNSGAESLRVPVTNEMLKAIEKVEKASEDQINVAQSSITPLQLKNETAEVESKRGRPAKASKKGGSTNEEKSSEKTSEEKNEVSVSDQLGLTPSSPSEAKTVEAKTVSPSSMSLPKEKSADETATYQETLDALKAVNTKHNMVVARQVLSRFGVSRVADLGDKTKSLKIFRDFINYCNEVLGQPTSNFVTE